LQAESLGFNLFDEREELPFNTLLIKYDTLAIHDRSPLWSLTEDAEELFIGTRLPTEDNRDYYRAERAFEVYLLDHSGYQYLRFNELTLDERDPRKALVAWALTVYASLERELGPSTGPPIRR
jgi:hypothetical protein